VSDETHGRYRDLYCSNVCVLCC
ncbi:phosphotransferase system, EIIC family protein, partial [Vibrio parahaemolyticus V-223/04]